MADSVVGQRFERWLVTGYSDGYYICTCDCGRTGKVRKRNLVDGSSKRCDQCRRDRASCDLTGVQIGNWTVGSEWISRRNGRAWKATCSCGVEQYVMAVNLLSGNSRQCRACATRPRGYDHEVLPRPMWDRIVTRAARKCQKLTVDKVFLEQLLITQNYLCALSNLPITVLASSTSGCTASLDRIDSSLGYTPGNVQWVHKTINMMKNKLSTAEFVYFCNAVSANHHGDSRR